MASWIVSYKLFSADSPFELTYEVNILTRTYGEVKKIANFEFQSTNEGATEILALISPSSCVAHETDSFELGSGWNFLYLGKILPFLESFELLPKIQVEKKLADAIQNVDAVTCIVFNEYIVHVYRKKFYVF